jgi:hypothetical protein
MVRTMHPPCTSSSTSSISNSEPCGVRNRCNSDTSVPVSKAVRPYRPGRSHGVRSGYVGMISTSWTNMAGLNSSLDAGCVRRRGFRRGHRHRGCFRPARAGSDRRPTGSAFAGWVIEQAPVWYATDPTTTVDAFSVRRTCAPSRRSRPAARFWGSSLADAPVFGSISSRLSRRLCAVLLSTTMIAARFFI